MAVRQGGQEIHTIGGNFTGGASLTPFNLNLYPDLPIELVVKTKGSWSYECRAKIYDSNNNLVLQHLGGYYWSNVGEVLATTAIEDAEEVTYYAHLYSTQSAQGYGGFRFGFLQGREFIANVGSGFTSGSTYGPVEVKVKKGKEVHLQVYSLPQETNFVGLTLKDSAGNTIFDQQPGETLWGGRIYQVFFPSA